MNLQLHYYLFRLRQLLNCKWKIKREILKFTKKNMKEYLANHKRCSFQGLVSYFGTPETIAAGYNSGDKMSKRKFLASKPVARVLVLTLCWLAALTAVFVLAMFLLQQFAPTTPVYEAAEMAKTMQCV